jgi:hypothetical protein
MKLMNLAFLFLATLAIACGGGNKAGSTTPAGNGAQPGGPPPSVDQPPPPADARLQNLFEQLATDLATAGTDCDKYAQSVATWTTANGQRYKQLHADAKALDLGRPELKAFNKRLAQNLATVVKGFARCRNNEAAAKAFQGFDALIERN